ncbi:MAG TPA: hypothetical protein VHV74_23365 [Pseudonocardiaceae bacterium]|nr:hypothetical protein [Pseudonocardiaceae bacterium]
MASGGEPTPTTFGGEPIVIQGGHSTIRVQTSFGGATSGQLGAFAGQAGDAVRQPVAQAIGAAVGPTSEASGAVTAVHDVAQRVALPPGRSQADLTLDVARPDGSTYAVPTRLGFRSPERRAAIAAVGNRLPLLVDQNDPGRVTVDVARLNLP